MFLTLRIKQTRPDRRKCSSERGMGRRSTWEQEQEQDQETSFGVGKAQEKRLTDSCVDSLYKGLSKHYKRTSDATH